MKQPYIIKIDIALLETTARIHTVAVQGIRMIQKMIQTSSETWKPSAENILYTDKRSCQKLTSKSQDAY